MAAVAAVVAFWVVVLVVAVAAVVYLVEVYLDLPPWLLVVVLAKHGVQPWSILVFWVE